MFTVKLPTADWPTAPDANEPIPGPVDGDTEAGDRTADEDPPPAPAEAGGTATISFEQPAEDADHRDDSNTSDEGKGDEADTGVDATIEAGTSA